jgi:LPS O-antigen subunit length determinant protein (WzzB/FepE family)
MKMKQVKLVQQTPDELDVTVILEKALHFCSQYGKLIAGVAFAGILAGLLRFWTVPNLYTSSMVLQPTVLSDPEQMALINNWSALLKKRELHVLAAEFRVSPALLKKVQSITTEELQKSYAPNNYTAFTLTVLVTDTTVLSSIQAGILYALDHSSYIKDKLASRKRTLQLLIQSTGQEINRLYQLQASIDSNIHAGNNSHGGFIVDVSEISNQITSLQEKKLGFEDSYSFTSAVQVLQGFYTPSKPEFPKMIKLVSMGCAGGLMLGMLAALLLAVRKKLTNKQATPATA